MPSIIWPLTLPQTPVINGYKEQMPSNLIRSDAEYGPAKVRKRGGARPVTVNASYILSTEEAEILDAFVYNSIGGGAICFDWPRPRFSKIKEGNNRYVRARLVPSSDSLYSKSNVSNTVDFWQVDLTLEIFPDVPTMS